MRDTNALRPVEVDEHGLWAGVGAHDLARFVSGRHSQYAVAPHNVDGLDPIKVSHITSILLCRCRTQTFFGWPAEVSGRMLCSFSLAVHSRSIGAVM
jgi:hypothetical protein